MIPYSEKDPTGLGPIETSQTTQILVPFYASWSERRNSPYYTPQTGEFCRAS